MTIVEKIIRVNEIGEELKTIKVTLDGIRYLAGTVNAETTNRCFIIVKILDDRINLLHEEFQRLDKEIKGFAKDNGV